MTKSPIRMDLFHQDMDAGEKVRQGVLERQGHGKTADTEGREEGGDGNTENAQD